MNPNDPRYFRIRITGGQPQQMSLFARVLSAIAGAAVFVLAIIAGGFLLVLFLGLALAIGAVFAVRMWWWRRKLAAADIPGRPSPSRNGAKETVEGDYRVIDD